MFGDLSLTTIAIALALTNLFVWGLSLTTSVTLVSNQSLFLRIFLCQVAFSLVSIPLEIFLW